MLEEESIRLRQEEMERERMRAYRPPQQVYEPLNYKDTKTKTFYIGYVQQKYTNAEQPFPERNLSYNLYGNNICLDCGKMKIIDVENQYFKSNDNCPSCGKIILQNV